MWTILGVNSGRWDIFCKVIDNHGDIGVCWRLSADLAARGHQVRLWVDDASALDWMAPRGCAGVQVLAWSAATLAHLQTTARADVVIEAFGCELEADWVAHYADPAQRAAVWINLEYLSAQAYVERCHGLPSPVLHGPGKGLAKHFFYPGFTAATGGLLREVDLAQRQSAFDRQAWLAQQGIDLAGERLISLFCYEPPALGALLEQLMAGPQRTRLLLCSGRGQAAARALLRQRSDLGQLALTWLDPLSQRDYDHLLWACDLNFVRGEDSLVRALWAAKPFVWNIYPQHDQAHQAKLEAFLDMLQAPPSLRQFHQAWNGLTCAPLPSLDLDAWGESARAARHRLLQQPELVQRLAQFVGKNS
ncbi:MAG: elongation factor P maturation arginine rhamnosyltransferase EarP [Betaproteobacteria bacterium]